VRGGWSDGGARFGAKPSQNHNCTTPPSEESGTTRSNLVGLGERCEGTLTWGLLCSSMVKHASPSASVLFAVVERSRPTGGEKKRERGESEEREEREKIERVRTACGG
jgi:hypothetical protein